MPGDYFGDRYFGTPHYGPRYYGGTAHALDNESPIPQLAMRMDAHVIANAWFDPQLAGGLFADDMLTSGVAVGGVFILIIGRGPGMTLAGSGGLVS